MLYSSTVHRTLTHNKLDKKKLIDKIFNFFSLSKSFFFQLISATQESPVLFKKNLDLLYKVKGSGMMKAGKLCVSAIFRPIPSVAKSGKCACQAIIIQLRLLFHIQTPRAVTSGIGVVNVGAKSGQGALATTTVTAVKTSLL